MSYRRPRRLGRLRAILPFILCAVSAAHAGAAPQHVGAASCAGTGCHGAAGPIPGSHVQQNEFIVWQREDAHANAWRLLDSDKGKRIAQNLGLGPATGAAACLACHSDAVPPEQQGRRWRAADGVSCETCHGGAEKWIATHAQGATHADNVAAGLRPLADPAARAALCLSCHQGGAGRPVDHRLMAAGHPPLVFELDTFTAIQPAHFSADADYAQRKGAVSGARNWSAGQFAAAGRLLQELRGPRFALRGLFPELSFYDCSACHHPADAPRWSAGVAGALGPGTARLAAAPLELAGVVLDVLAPARAAAWRQALATLHAASQDSPDAVRSAATALEQALAAAQAETARAPFDRRQAQALAAALARFSAGPAAASFTTAEQASMGLGTLCNELAPAAAQRRALKPALDAVYASVGDRRRYDPDRFRSAVRKLGDALARSPA